MLRAKSPFKKRSPKIDEEDDMPAPARPVLHHYSNVQEFQELQKQQQLLNGNAWAQQKGRSRTNSQIAIDELNTPFVTMGDILESSEPDVRNSTSGLEVKKTKKRVPAPLKLIPDNAKEAIPTQRDSLESKKHRVMQVQMTMASHDSTDDIASKLRTSTASDSNTNIEHIPRPKSPGKKLFQKFFRTHTSSETPPKISPEFEVTPEKAVKILGKESLSRKKEGKASKKLSSSDEKLMSTLDFKCAGEGTRGRADTNESTAPSTTSTAEFDAPTDREIRSIGGVGRYATRVPTVAVQRTVSDTATMNTISAAIDGKLDRASEGMSCDRHHKHLQYINNAIPPTPPSKDSRREKMMRPAVTDIPSMDVHSVLNDNPETPDTAFRIGSQMESLPVHLPVPRYRGNDYLNLVLNKPSVASLRGTSSIRSAYGFVISPSAELANGSNFNSPTAHFIESPIIPRSAGLPSSREASFGSKRSTPPRGRTLSRRWSDTSLEAYKMQSERAAPCLPPTFYSPYNFAVPAEYRNFTRPSANDDPSLYYLPQAAAGDLGSFASRTSSEGKPTPSTSAESSFSDKAPNDQAVLDKDATPISKQRRFVVKKRCSSNIAATARSHAIHGLGLSPLINETMHHLSHSSVGSEDGPFPNGPASAVPHPLNVDRFASPDGLPAKEELDAFLSLHLHLDHTTNATHHFVDRKFEQNMHTSNVKHDETLKMLSASFGEILTKVNGIEENSTKTEGAVANFKMDVSNKIMDMMELLQAKVLNPMVQMMESNAQLDKSVNHLIARVAELEKSQREVVELVKIKDKQTSAQSVTLPPIDPSPTPATDASPHHSFTSQSFAVNYPAPYAGNPASASGVYGYMPYYADNGAYAAAQGWGGQALDAAFAKMPREQRMQHMQSRYAGSGMHIPTHPAYKNGDRKSGQGYKDGPNEF